jgi:anti-sigma regulatory factor (Ser/Thr protein kinase)
MTDAVEFARAVGPASAGEARRLRHEAREWLAGLDLDDDTRDRVLAAVSEAVENAVEHAYPGGEAGSIELTLWCEPRAVNVAVTDHGAWAAETGTAGPAAPNSTAPRGRGIVLMHRSVDSVAIRHGVGGTTVALRQERPRGGPAPAS